MYLSVNQVQACCPRNKNPEALTDALNTLLEAYEINSSERVAAFLAQCGHESLDFTVLQENLNYGAKGLRGVFPKYFPTDELAAQYERKPEMIANRVYGNRMGNGDEASGDGYRYRGRGAIQLTGKNNYERFAAAIGGDMEQTIAYLETLQGAIESACWFWKNNGLNEIADTGDIVKMTKRINGGTIGLEDRKKHYEHNLQVLL